MHIFWKIVLWFIGLSFLARISIYLSDILSINIVSATLALLLFFGLPILLLAAQAHKNPEETKRFLMKFGFSDATAGYIVATLRKSKQNDKVITNEWSGDKKYGVVVIESKYECSKCKLTVLSAYTPKKDFAGKCPKNRSGHNWHRKE